MDPDELSKAINKYTNHKSYIYGHNNENKILLTQKYDILHLHNRIWHFENANKKIIQYHSEPKMVDLIDDNSIDRKLVISQYQATLNEFKDCHVVRNVIDFKTPLYNMVDIDRIRIGFSPSRIKKLTNWHDKGYVRTVKTLKKLRKHKKNVEIDIITGVSLKECIQRKARCNILIDEVVTTSFHRSGLEGLALGKATICYVGDAVEKTLFKVTGSNVNPFINVSIDNLYDELLKLVNGGIMHLISMGRNSRAWMEAYWEPRAIVEEFIKIYKS